MEQQTSNGSKSNGEPFVIAGWRVDSASLRISNDKKTIKLEPKAMAVLDYLACRPGTVVSRRELEETVWEGTIVGYDALSNAIIKLRKALGDKARKPHIIETIAKTGYRLIAEVNFSRENSLTQSVVSGEPSPTTKPSIAVLPFDNMSGDPEQEYFSDGITEDIITELSRFHDLFVIARHSSFAFKNKSMDIADIGNQLGIQYIVEGSVRKSGARVRISAQLIEVATGKHIWADRYDRDLEDIFTVQDEVVRIITSTMEGRVGHARQGRATNKLASNMDAYDWFAQGRELFHNTTSEENVLACEMFEKVISLEPDFAPAHAFLAEAYIRDWFSYWNEPLETVYDRAWTSAKQSLLLDETDSRCQTAMSVAYLFSGDHEQALFRLNKALALNPGDTHALTYISRYEMFLGNWERSIELIEEARRYDPFGIYDWSLVTAYFVAHDYDKAIHLMRTLQNPAPTMLIGMAAVYAQAGDIQNASKLATDYIDVTKAKLASVNTPFPDVWLNFISIRWPFRHKEDREHFLDGLRKSGIPD